MSIPFASGRCETNILVPAYVVEVGGMNLGEGDSES
jgi:hypothetical protein